MIQDLNKFNARLIELAGQLTGEELDMGCLERPLAELNIDSLMLLELAVHLEREYGVRLEEDELTSLRTLSDIATTVADKKRS
ncbi:acyl carrier protein [Paenibacillus cellulosilyticus]|uniref:Acyl carrier protein n=1 Tax=Paenibacillus cellulosilyticus TaxID=375489 RepID=A0A2V2YUV9_9BACL|nr:acyl carrier protein [Paenibacillus cellulosilyticus]PWW03240.1 acyl carrier protein [Paenibacillus cellulosilyticus]QKS43727.1 acyl carrier protein [Paenibacillus cellulosilyticus]